MALGFPLIAASGPDVQRCASCGSPTSVTSGCSEHVILMPTNEDPACPRLSRTAGARERTPSSPEAKGYIQCRRCSGEQLALDSDTPKLGRKYLQSPRLAARNWRCARVAALTAAVALLLLYFVLCAVLAGRELRQRWMPTVAGPVPGTPGGIPKIIHQMYKSSELPDKWRDVPATWASHHPPGEYRYMLWTDEDLRKLIESDYPWLLATYDTYPFATQRWDASRYAVLHKYGGLYADLDLHPVAKVDSLLQGQTLLLPHTPNVGLTNAVMASTAGHPFMDYALRQLPRYKDRWYHLSKHNTVLSSTGSTFIWVMHMTWVRDFPEADAARLLPAADWGKCSYCDAVRGAPVSSTPAPQPTPKGPTAVVPPAASGTSGAPGAAPSSDGAAERRALLLGSRASSGAGRRGQPSRWQSPFAHGEGSSWHSLDSLLLLFFFCNIDLLVVLAAAGGVGWYTRSRKGATATALSMLLLVTVQRSSGIVLFELLIGRPWIWLIMT